MTKGFVIQHTDKATYVGRYTLTGNLSFVPFAFAYVYDTFNDAENARSVATCCLYTDTTIVSLTNVNA